MQNVIKTKNTVNQSVDNSVKSEHASEVVASVVGPIQFIIYSLVFVGILITFLFFLPSDHQPGTGGEQDIKQDTINIEPVFTFI